MLLPQACWLFFEPFVIINGGTILLGGRFYDTFFVIANALVHAAGVFLVQSQNEYRCPIHKHGLTVGQAFQRCVVLLHHPKAYPSCFLYPILSYREGWFFCTGLSQLWTFTPLIAASHFINYIYIEEDSAIFL